MDRHWIQLDTRSHPEYIKGVMEFLNFATSNMRTDSVIRCPCSRCHNCVKRSPTQVRDHIFIHGMLKTYVIWDHHGEVEEDNVEEENEDIDDFNMPIEDDELEVEDDELEKSFVIEDAEHTKKAIIQEMGKFYHQHKYKMHKHFLKYATTAEALQHKPDGIKDHEWWFLCQHFSDPVFMERSVVNKRNRTARRTNHCSRTKSFARVSKDLETREGVHLDRIQLWYETHYNKKTKKWSDANSEDIYNKLQEAKAISEAEGDTSGATIDEIFYKVVGRKSGYVQGSGPGPKPKTKALADEEARRKEAEDRANTAEKLNAELLQQVAELKSRQDEIEKNLMKKLGDELQDPLRRAMGDVQTWV